jgi:energy-converting hydrogenase Eha subunit B
MKQQGGSSTIVSSLSLHAFGSDRDGPPDVKAAAAGRAERAGDLGEEGDLLAVLLVVLKEQLRRDVDLALAGLLGSLLIVVLLDREVPERDGPLGRGRGED